MYSRHDLVGRPTARSLPQQAGAGTVGRCCNVACTQRRPDTLTGAAGRTTTIGLRATTATASLRASKTAVRCRRIVSVAASSSSSSSSSTRTHQPEMCVIVDESNRVVGAATRYETVSKRLLGRGSYVLVFNSAGQLFVSKRSSKKDCYPGCLDVTISGVVNQGEEYADTAARELQEEIGVPATQSSSLLQQLFIFPYKDDVCHVWGCAFRFTWDGPVSFQDAEVEWGKFVGLQELQQQLQREPGQFTPVGRHILGLYFDHMKQEQMRDSQQS